MTLTQFTTSKLLSRAMMRSVLISWLRRFLRRDLVEGGSRSHGVTLASLESSGGVRLVSELVCHGALPEAKAKARSEVEVEELDAISSAEEGEEEGEEEKTTSVA